MGENAMIPHGLNPFGLEDRILTFHVIDENGTETETIQKTNRLYCYAEFPEKYASLSMLEWTTQRASTEAAYNALPKYVTRNPNNLGVNQFMVMGNQDFYYQTFPSSVEPEETIYRIKFDTRIFDTYWEFTGRNYELYTRQPVYRRSYGQQLGALPDTAGGENSVQWPSSFMDAPGRGSQHYNNNQYTSTLLGWYDQKIGGTQAQPTTTVTGDKTYYAKWHWTFQREVENGQNANGNQHCYFAFLPGRGKYHLSMPNIPIYHDGSPSGHPFCFYLCYDNPQRTGARTPMGGQCISGQSHENDCFNVLVEDMTINPGSPISSTTSIGSLGTGVTSENLENRTYRNIPFFYATTTGKGEITVSIECVFTFPDYIYGGLYYNLYLWSFQESVNGSGRCNDPSNYYFNGSSVRPIQATLTML